MTLAIRPAAPSDSALVFSFIRDLADYERLAHEVDATEEAVAAALFCDHPRVFADIAEWNGEAAGFALWFYNFSTFRGRHGIYLEDLFVRPAYRRHGIGKALLQHLAAPMRDGGPAAGSNGGCSTGTSRRSASTGPSAPSRWTSGRCSV